MLAHLACEVEEGEVFHPVVVVHHFGGIGILGLKVEEFGHLFLYGLLVVV